jgi:hypothetical protein
MNGSSEREDARERRAGLWLIGLIWLVASCGPAFELVIINRSDTPLALAPGVIIQGCSEAGLTAAEVERASRELTQVMVSGDESWIPVGAMQLPGPPGQRIGAPKPQTLVISGTVGPRVFDGPVPEQDLPPCGGAALGIE